MESELFGRDGRWRIVGSFREDRHCWKGTAPELADMGFVRLESPRLGDNDSGGVLANHKRQAKKDERNVVWWETCLGNRESSPLLSRTW